MVQVYLACLICSVLFLLAFFVFNDKYNATNMILTLILIISNWGYYCLSIASNTNEAVLSMKIAYVGGTYLPVLMFFSICEICHITLSKLFRIILIAIQTGLFFVINTIGQTGLYYVNPELRIENGQHIFYREYGPFHTVHYVLMISYMLAAVVVTIVSLRRKNIVSAKNVKLTLFVLLIGCGCYFSSKLFHTVYDVAPISNTILFGIILLPLFRMSGHYFISENISRVIESTQNVCYLAFDRDVHYLGSNDTAKKLFKDISALEIDKKIPESDSIISSVIVPKINSFIKDNDDTRKLIKINGGDWEIKINKILKKNKYTMGYLVEIMDVSSRQKYIDMVERYNQSLEEQVLKEKESKRLIEDALNKAEIANKSKSAFLSKMSHEIRTPLNAVLGMNEMIIRETVEDDTREYAQNIHSAGQTLLSLINDILDLSKIESGKMEIIPNEYDLNSVINDLVNIIKPKAKERHLEFNLELDNDIPHLLYGDEIRLKQIIMNILSNAVKYTKQGSVTLSVSHDVVIPGREIMLKVSVKDTGIGIKKDDINKLFSPYQRIEEKKNRYVEGTGLGMSITKQLLDLMDSHLDVSSIYGEGSVFSFEIKQEVRDAVPVGKFADKFKKAEKAKHAVKFTAPEANILVVDDVETNLIVVKHLLKASKVQLDMVKSGRECLELTKEKKYDIIFLDHMMPEMDGYETLEAIKAQAGVNNNTPIIVLTANVIVGAKEEYLEAGFVDYLGKPIESAKLENMLLTYIPEEKIIKATGEEKTSENGEIDFGNMSDARKEIFEKIRKIKGIDVFEGMKASGDAETYVQVTEDYYNTGDNRVGLISKYYEAMDYKNYTIQVHALKSTSRLIGYMDLSKLSEELEAAGNGNDEAVMAEKTPVLMKMYREVLAELGAIFEDTSDKEPIAVDDLSEAMNSMREALESFDVDTADFIVQELNKHSMPDKFKNTFKKIKVLLSEVDREGLIKTISDSEREWGN